MTEPFNFEAETLRAQVKAYERSADEHVAKFDRKHEALVKAESEIERLRRENRNLREMIDAGGDRFRRVQSEVERLEVGLKAAKAAGFTRRHANAVPALCDLCPKLAAWKLKGSRYCDTHAVEEGRSDEQA